MGRYHETHSSFGKAMGCVVQEKSQGDRVHLDLRAYPRYKRNISKKNFYFKFEGELK